MRYPTFLTPQLCQRIVLSSEREVCVPKTTPTFLKWTGPASEDTYNGKPVLEFKVRRYMAPGKNPTVKETL